jgi:Y_Y_Y domain
VYSSIPLSASASGGSEKLYKFFAYHNGVWTVLQDYSASSTLNWVPKVSGDHKLVVHAKDKYSQKSYDSYKTFTFKIVNAPVMQSLSTSSASPQLLGKTVQIKASAIGGTEKLYKFWVYDGSTWLVLKDYSEVASFDWKPASKGNYKISVHVKDRYSIRSYDSYKAFHFTIK